MHARNARLWFTGSLFPCTILRLLNPAQRAMPENVCDQDHYSILDLPPENKLLDEKALKLAYRRALLLHHPDKTSTTSKSKPSVDQITAAYKTLSDPTSRSAYDRKGTLKSSQTSETSSNPHTGLETVDLDDLDYDDAQGTWYRSCRCGKRRAYVITEESLEVNVDCGEIIVGCQGCSLWLRITFAAAEDE